LQTTVRITLSGYASTRSLTDKTYQLSLTFHQPVAD
jgi:hypothetical protein